MNGTRLIGSDDAADRVGIITNDDAIDMHLEHVQHHKPHLRIRLTCNPKWPEFVAALEPGQTATDRPDLVARVFRLNVKALLHDIVDAKSFGDVLAYSYVILFLKRGLPDMHLVVTLRHRPGSADAIDNIVSADIPDLQTDPEMYAKVARHMMHGPCGALAAPCRGPAPCISDDGTCTKDYPKTFVAETVANGPDGCPIYRRRENGREVQRDDMLLDNRSVVPYNHAFLEKYDAHINVEVGVQCVKYFNEYLMKGHDRGPMAFGTNDEINQYVDGRYISGVEASWRLFRYNIIEQQADVVEDGVVPEFGAYHDAMAVAARVGKPDMFMTLTCNP